MWRSHFRVNCYSFIHELLANILFVQGLHHQGKFLDTPPLFKPSLGFLMQIIPPPQAKYLTVHLKREISHQQFIADTISLWKPSPKMLSYFGTFYQGAYTSFSGIPAVQLYELCERAASKSFQIFCAVGRKRKNSPQVTWPLVPF